MDVRTAPAPLPPRSVARFHPACAVPRPVHARFATTRAPTRVGYRPQRHYAVSPGIGDIFAPCGVKKFTTTPHYCDLGYIAECMPLSGALNSSLVDTDGVNRSRLINDAHSQLVQWGDSIGSAR